MSATTFDLLINWIWPRPGESFSSEEAGLTPPVYIDTPQHVNISLLDIDSNCQTLLRRLQDYRRLISPSRLLLLHQRHFFLEWRHPDSRPIYVQLLVREQVQAMQSGLLSDYPAATWTGNRWVNDDAYISLWGPGCRFTRSHLNDYRHLLERATHELCALLRIEHRPRRTVIHSLRIQRLRAIGTDEALASIDALQQEYRRSTKRLSNLANKERRKQRDLKRTNSEYGLPLNVQWTRLKSDIAEDGPTGSSSSTIESNHSMPSRATRVPGADTPTNQMSQTPGLGSGGGVSQDGRTRNRSLTTAASFSSGWNRQDTSIWTMTDQTPGPGSGGGDASLARICTVLDPPEGRGPRCRSPTSYVNCCAEARRQHLWLSVRAADQTPGPGSGGGSADRNVSLSTIQRSQTHVSFSPRSPATVPADSLSQVRGCRH